jgi:methionyl-tRNA formyltransferase
MSPSKKISVIGCKHTTKDFILGLKRHGITLDYCISIDNNKGEEQKVAGYYDLSNFLQKENIPLIIVPSYNLKSAECKKLLKPLNIDLLLVIGWQRLIPNWFLDSFSIGAYGMHGSSKPLPYGRGRSPINWSLIQNKKIFYTHFFQYLPGVDDGPIVGVQMFDITEHDDCHTLHLKNTISMIKICVEYIPSMLDGTVSKISQAKNGICYYPKRTEEDGIIFWEDLSLDIFNLIRAVTRPFPGAFTFIGNEKVKIWKAIPFDSKILYSDAKPGEIVESFYDLSFVVKTGDTTILVQDYDGIKINRTFLGSVFHNNESVRKTWKDCCN